MGFSVSASVAILFVAMLVTFGMFYSAASDTVERISDAKGAAQNGELFQENTAINITDASYFVTNDSLVVRIDNTGTTTLSVPDTDVLVDNELMTGGNVSVEGIETTELWQPGETVRYEYNDTFETQPDRVKVVSGPGVADAEVVTSG